VDARGVRERVSRRGGWVVGVLGGAFAALKCFRLCE